MRNFYNYTITSFYVNIILFGGTSYLTYLDEHFTDDAAMVGKHENTDPI